MIEGYFQRVRKFGWEQLPESGIYLYHIYKYDIFFQVRGVDSESDCQSGCMTCMLPTTYCMKNARLDERQLRNGIGL